MIAEEVIQWLADALAYSMLGITLYGVWRSARRRASRMSGPRARWLSIPWFYLVTIGLFLGLCYASWRPLPVPLRGAAQGWLFAAGALVYFPGMLLALWGRLELGRNYYASSALTARLFENNGLVMTGPFSMVRHPMYLGLTLAAAGSLPMYFTWTTVLFIAFALLLLLRAPAEERVLAVEFGDAWWAYCTRVPMLLPRLGPAKPTAPDEALAVRRRL